MASIMADMSLNIWVISFMTPLHFPMSHVGILTALKCSMPLLSCEIIYVIALPNKFPLLELCFSQNNSNQQALSY